ncbi:MAG: helix-turn-helix transcriptional regulator [Saprospiraceae bacterium]|nr:helix-turn-helix transcriptional regulator [Saprospiraceae bacterium]
MIPSSLQIEIEIINKSKNENRTPGLFRKSVVYLVMCVGKDVNLVFNPMYSRTLQPGKSFIIYDPDKDLPYNVIMEDESLLCILKIELSILHGMFIPNIDIAPIFNPEQSHKKFYEEREFSAEIVQIINQINLTHLTENSKELFLHAKAIEILSLFFGSNKPNTVACPFLNNDSIVRKIKQAKDILLEGYNQEITLSEVAKRIGLNEYQLKVGFKEIYGNTPYQYVLDYKLELAKQLLQKKQLQVNEIADHIGYTNISHFIAAFKRKYGMTPKQFMLR